MAGQYQPLFYVGTLLGFLIYIQDQLFLHPERSRNRGVKSGAVLCHFWAHFQVQKRRFYLAILLPRAWPFVGHESDIHQI